MPECTLCNSDCFDILDGMYFCTQCGTQSQDVHEMVNETDDTFNTKLVIKKTVKRKTKVRDFGKPWFTLEGFQIVLKAQIEFLIKYGVDPALKDVVGQMWFAFVERSTNAFGTRESEDFSSVLRMRDILKDFVPTDSIHRKTLKRSRKVEDVDDALELSSEIAREDFYEGDDPTGLLFEDNEEAIEQESHVGSVDQAYNHRNTDANPKIMSMQHTLAFCFLALLWLQEPICLSDLIRWAVQGEFPYFNATAYFPSYMKLSQSDSTIFTRTTVPTKLTIKVLTSSLSRYIELPEIPRHQLNIYIARYTIDLQLPELIHRHINCLLHIVDMDTKPLDKVINYEDVAMACIIVSLRLIYGLDDETEHKLSQEATVVEKDTLYFPTWCKVIETIHSSHHQQVETGVPWNTEDLRVLKDARNYGRFCRETVFGSWKAKSNVQRQKRYYKGAKGVNAEKQEEYANMFSLLLNTDDEDVIQENEDIGFPDLSNCKKNETNDSGDVSMRSTHDDAKGLSLDNITRFYQRREAMEKESLKPPLKNRYIRYRVPMKRNFCSNDKWNDLQLPNSLRQLIELCSRLIYIEPVLLLNEVQRLENKLFKVTD